MSKDFKNGTAELLLQENIAVIGDMKVNEDNIGNLNNLMMEIIECLPDDLTHYCWDLTHISLFTSYAFGQIYMLAQKEKTEKVILLNSNQAVLYTAEMTGFGKGEGPRSKVEVVSDSDVIFEMLGRNNEELNRIIGG